MIPTLVMLFDLLAWSILVMDLETVVNWEMRKLESMVVRLLLLRGRSGVGRIVSEVELEVDRRLPDGANGMLCISVPLEPSRFRCSCFVCAVVRH